MWAEHGQQNLCFAFFLLLVFIFSIHAVCFLVIWLHTLTLCWLCCLHHWYSVFLLGYFKETAFFDFCLTTLSSQYPISANSIDEQTEDMFFRLVKQLAEKEGITEKLKSENQMLWVRKMNNIRNCTEEIVNKSINNIKLSTLCPVYMPKPICTGYRMIWFAYCITNNTFIDELNSKIQKYSLKFEVIFKYKTKNIDFWFYMWYNSFGKRDCDEKWI